jgi:hypothetical protein
MLLFFSISEILARAEIEVSGTITHVSTECQQPTIIDALQPTLLDRHKKTLRSAIQLGQMMRHCVDTYLLAQ